MRRKRFLLPVFFIFVLAWTAVSLAGFETGKVYHGFKLEEKRFVKEVNAECLLFHHEKSGARLLKIAAEDANKTFCVSFKTVPESDAGTPHIMEHCVLNGSKHFPVKSPFDVLMKGSLKTFLNAMTGSDRTMYPVASMNNKDYFNLMHVYMDAVFYPLIYDDPRIFKQEGWHYELTGMDDPVVYKGVVYNEMKGAFSSAERELGFQADRHLFPDNGYGLSSGGYPASIPSLTYGAFLDFHRRYYHPSNSYIYLYGDADLDKELAFLDSEYLSHFEDEGFRAEIPLQKPFSEMKKVSSYYSAAEGSGTEDQTFLMYSMVTGLNTDLSLVYALDVLTDVLVNHESAPIRLALQEAGIGKDVSASISTSKQNVVQITVRNANPGDADRFLEIVNEKLAEAAEKGVDRETAEGIINRMEFRLREGNTPHKGLMYNMQALNGWFFAEDPFFSLEYEKPLAEVKAALKSDYFEKVIKEHLMDNPHSLLLVLEPKPGREKEINAAVESELTEFKSGMSDEAKEKLVKETQELIEYQKREDTPEALATIPLLNLSDIDPRVEWYAIEKKDVAGVPVLHHEAFTNNIVYVNLFFDMRTLPEELIPYASLLSEVMGSMNTENYTYGDLDNALNIHTGGFSTGLSTYLEDQMDENLLPKFRITCKAVGDKTDKLFELTEEIVTRTLLDDPERLKTVLIRHQARLDGNIKRNGFYYAMLRMMSYYSKNGMLSEKTGGVDYYRFVTDLTENYDQKSGEIIDHLKKTAKLLFTRDNLIAAVACGADEMAAYAGGLKGFAGALPEGKATMKTWTLETAPKNEGLLSASKVQYVVQGYDFKKLGYAYDGKMRVLNQILSTDYLQTQVRVIGGAYGGFAGFSSSGQVYFGSYRDPNLTETLETYAATPEYLSGFKADDKDMTRYIIGTVSGMDRPLTPSQKGNVAVSRYFQNITLEDLKAEKKAVLATTPEDIRAMSEMIRKVLDKNIYCVYGNEEKVKAAADRFGELVELTKNP
jgi:Zn-dependent M16 (insulinase) family peptidase